MTPSSSAATGVPRLAAGGSYRWTVLAVGALAQATSSAYFQGLAAVALALRLSHGLSVASLGALLGAPTAGLVLTLLLWGRLTDRVGDRLVMSAGLLGAGLALAAASVATHAGCWPAGCSSPARPAAGVNAASGRAVLSWFPGAQRGVAMGIRETSVPLGAAGAAFALPPLVATYDVAGGPRVLASGLPARRRRRRRVDPGACGPRRRRLRSSRRPDQRAAGCADARSGAAVRPARAAAVAAGGREQPAGRRPVSDRVASRTRPLRLLALAMAVGALLLAAAVDGPLPLLEVVLVVETALVVCWNGLAFAAAGELAPAGQVGTALAFQNTGNFVAATVTPPAMGLAISLTGYRPALALLAVPATLSARLLARSDAGC